MRYDEIGTAETTITGLNAQALFLEVCMVPTWRCYSSAFVADLEPWINRFLGAHCRVPGIMTSEMLGTVPIDVARWTKQDGDQFIRAEGITFLNGAVFKFYPPGDAITLLFVDNDVAEVYKYPEGYRFLGKS